MGGTRSSETSVIYIPICTTLCPEGFNLPLDIPIQLHGASRSLTHNRFTCQLLSGDADRSLTLRGM
jgi:hypothetical protein